MKWITFEEFMKLKLPTDKAFEKIEALNAEVCKHYPSKIMVRLDEYDGKQYFQYAEVRLLHSDIKITIKHDEYRKKYYVLADMRDHFKNIDHNEVERLSKDLEAPKNIGVLSAKKITEWVNYYEALYSRAYRRDQENGSEKDLFLKSLEGLPVKWSKDKKQGWIIKNGIEFSFTIGDTYISKNMQLHYSASASIEVFKLLADNKYRQKD